MPHAARRQVGLPAVGQGRPRAGVLLGVVVLPLDAHRAVEADAVQLDEDLFQAVGVAGGAGGDEVPAVGPVAHRPVAAEPAGPAVLAGHLHALDVGAVDALAELADELDHRDVLPFQVRAVEVEADHALVAGLVHAR